MGYLDVSVEVLREALRDLVREEVAVAVRAALAGDGGAQSSRTEYLSTADAARLAAVAQGTVRRWVREGRIEACGAGREIRLRRADVEALMRGGRRRGTGASGYGRRVAESIGTPEALASADFDSVWRGTTTKKRKRGPK